MVHGIRTMLDLHPDWEVLLVDVCNIFNSVSQLVIFNELRFLPNFLD